MEDHRGYDNTGSSNHTATWHLVKTAHEALYNGLLQWYQVAIESAKLLVLPWKQMQTHLTDAPCSGALDSGHDSILLMLFLFVFGLRKLCFALKRGTAFCKGCYNLFSCKLTT